MPSGQKSTDIDVVILQDATGSQQPYIDAARRFAGDYVEAIRQKASLKGGTTRYRVVLFKDHPEQGCPWIVQDSNPFVTNPQDVAKQMAGVVAEGGGDGPEAQIDGLDAVLRSAWRADAQRIVLLITDSPPHGIGEPGDQVPNSHPDALTVDEILNSYKKRHTVLFVIGCEPAIGRYQKAKSFYTQFAESTGGKYLSLPHPNNKATAMNNAIAGSVLQASDTLRHGDQWAGWITDNAHRSFNDIATDMHNHLASQGEHIHEVYHTDHNTPDHDVKYHNCPVTRSHVDNVVNKVLAQHKEDMNDPILSAIFG
ncbi:hypothetical protein CYLTODRAFT_416309 [Cylindrobasidium torrendii FP15055 ss-10]|uniref:VWFA domain-containing protein n=1 Tax=Cylindrobasidium torrendii FP15055 ss-10 TaxID=1314674 RepID=A0A0D7BWL7_9AGAR|nr:hypothetical protein CYLTODRAFT_416309 [Cylindrobasidium torrendii FP15055 ss-10]